ncbi:30S ribosomal protein S9 [bacterium]|nr:30S ribosomal protein S9 [bacterium]
MWGTGRRKSAVARVRLRDGSGKILINEREVEVFFTEDRDRSSVFAPLKVTQMNGKVDIFVNVAGGGFSGQAGATLLGIARALKKLNPDFDHVLRDNGFLTRDSREVERKKYGHKKARKRFQFSKR